MGRRFTLLVPLGMLWAFAMTLVRSLRWPNDWAEAHWLTTYEFGFVKRGLPGTLISPLVRAAADEKEVESAVRMVAACVFVLFCAAIFWMCLRVVRSAGPDPRGALACLVFLTSPYVVMSGHLNGYADGILMILTIASCALVLRGHVWVSALVVSAGLFVHETMLLVGLPSVLFAALLRETNEAPDRSLTAIVPRFALRHAPLLLLPAVALGWLIVQQRWLMHPAELEARLVAHLSRFGFIGADMNEMVPNLLTTSHFEFLSGEGTAFLHRLTRKRYIIQIGLPLLMLCAHAGVLLRPGRHRRTLLALLIAITLLPLLLHAIAWDTSRIWAYPLVVAMLGVWCASETRPSGEASTDGVLFYATLGVMVVVLQFGVSTPLMDSATERYPMDRRIVLSAPLLVMIAMEAVRRYRLTPR